MDEALAREDRLYLLETVRCLACGEEYAKPAGGGTVRSNPGCPLCGYVGWIAVSPPPARRARHRFAAGRPLFPLGRSG